MEIHVWRSVAKPGLILLSVNARPANIFLLTPQEAQGLNEELQTALTIIKKEGGLT